MGFITEVNLRDEYKQNKFTQYHVPEGTRFTPAAMQFLTDRRIELVYGGADKVDADEKPQAPVLKKYVCFKTGAVYENKPEHMTHIIGNKLVAKNHPRIAFRGKLDRFMAELIQVQITIQKAGYQDLLKDLDEVLDYMRVILRSEVMDAPIPEVNIMGMDEGMLREYSHYPKKYFGIDHLKMSYKYGEIAMGLNLLRTGVRQVELAAVCAFVRDDVPERKDILQGLNRLSSSLYIMILKFVSGGYKK